MFDARCPCCNRPVVGREEVLMETPATVPSACPHCHTSIHLVVAEPDEIVDAYMGVSRLTNLVS